MFPRESDADTEISRMEIDESKSFSLIVPVFLAWDMPRLKTLGNQDVKKERR
jgi:hypothetical protein